MKITSSPLRISLFGGGTDKLSFLNKYRKSLIFSFSINYFSYVLVGKNSKELFGNNFRILYSNIEKINKKNDIKNNFVRKFVKDNDINESAIIIRSDIPVGTGLSTSSAISACLIKHSNYKISKLKLAIKAYEFEKYFNKEVGIQDHLATSYGGVNFFKLNKNFQNIKQESLKEKDQKKISDILKKNSFLIWTETSESSLKNLNYDNSIQELEEISNLSSRFYDDYKKNGIKYESINYFLIESWKQKEKIINTNKKIDIIIKKLTKCKFIDSFKLLGAGGRGFFFCLANDKKKAMEHFKNYYLINDIEISNKGTQYISL